MSLNTDPKIDLMLSQSDRPSIIKVGNTTVVGEIHIKTKTDPIVEKNFQDTLASAEFIVTEHRCLPNDPYTAMSSEKRFMQAAQDHALEKKKSLLVLDDETSNRYQIWRDAGINISQDNFNLLLGIHAVLTDYSNHIGEAESLQRVFRLYQQLYQDPQLSQKMALATYFSIFHKSELANIDEKVQMDAEFLKLDGQAREVFYQKRLKGIYNNVGSRKMVIVVGRDHAQPIASTLTTGSITHIDESRVSNLNNSISKMKKRTSFDEIIHS